MIFYAYSYYNSTCNTKCGKVTFLYNLFCKIIHLNQITLNEKTITEYLTTELRIQF